MAEYKKKRAEANKKPARALKTVDELRRKKVEWRNNNKERLQHLNQKWTQQNRAHVQAGARKAAAALTDRYVRNVIAGSDRDVYAAIPQDVIEIKREQLIYSRLTKQLQQTINEVIKQGESK